MLTNDKNTIRIINIYKKAYRNRDAKQYRKFIDEMTTIAATRYLKGDIEGMKRTVDILTKIAMTAKERGVTIDLDTPFN